MPCLQGEHLNSDPLKGRLNKEEKKQIAEEIAKTLAEFHSWQVNDFGELDTNTLEIIPFKESYTSWLYERIRFWLEDAKNYSIITDKDEIWVEKLLESSKEAFETFSTPTFVMGDFKPGNFLIHLGKSGWEISGVFDFTNGYFGDPLSDLIKMLTYYLDNDEKEIAVHLLNVYCSDTNEKKFSKKRLYVHMLQQRVLDWGCAKAMNQVTWDSNLSFSDWVKSYTDSIAELLDLSKCSSLK